MTSKTEIDRYIKAMAPYFWNPCKWARDVARYEIDPWQEDFLENMIQGKRSAIVGCNGSGKDFITSIFNLFLLTMRPLLKGQCTGPSKQQIFDVVWAEIHKIISHSDMLPTLVTWEKTHVRNKMAPEEWFIVARTASKRYSKDGGDAQAEGIQGIRGLYTSVTITEASGVEDPNFEAARSCCATKNAFLGIVGNGLRRSGFFYDLFNKPAFADWYTKHVPYTASSWTDKAQMEAWIKEYGRNSSFVMARCFGEFPLQGAEDTAVPWVLVRAAMDREVPLVDGHFLQLGVDPARGGEDEAVIGIRTGAIVQPLRIWRTCTGPQLVKGIEDAVSEFDGNKDTLILIDESGLGGMGVIDPLREKGYREVVGVQNVQSPVRKDRYTKWDDEQWMEVIPGFLEEGVLPQTCFIWTDGGFLEESEDKLLTQLTVRRWKFTGKNNKQRKLETKDDLKARGYKSPDRAEAVMLCVAEDPRSQGEVGIYAMDGSDREIDKEALEVERHEQAIAEIESRIKQEGIYWP